MDFFAISNDELAKLPIDELNMMKCPHCGDIHQIKIERPFKTGKCTSLGFYECGEHTYLYSIDNRILDFSDES